MQKELILILDFGGQYTQLIARRVRECHVYSEVIPWNTPLADILARKPKGIILSGFFPTLFLIQKSCPQRESSSLQAGYIGCLRCRPGNVSSVILVVAPLRRCKGC